jgi:hypothetical protein
MQQVVEGWYDPAANFEKAEVEVEAERRMYRCRNL